MTLRVKAKGAQTRERLMGCRAGRSDAEGVCCNIDRRDHRRGGHY